MSSGDDTRSIADPLREKVFELFDWKGKTIGPFPVG